MAALGRACQGERALYEAQDARLGIPTRLDQKHGLVCRLLKTVGAVQSFGRAMHEE